MMIEERAKRGCFNGWVRNSYWRLTLLTLKGRAVPTLPLLVYLCYIVAVVGASDLPFLVKLVSSSMMMMIER